MIRHTNILKKFNFRVVLSDNFKIYFQNFPKLKPPDSDFNVVMQTVKFILKFSYWYPALRHNVMIFVLISLVTDEDELFLRNGWPKTGVNSFMTKVTII